MPHGCRVKEYGMRTVGQMAEHDRRLPDVVRRIRLVHLGRDELADALRPFDHLRVGEPLRAVPAAARPVTVYLPANTKPKQAAALRQAGWCTLSGLITVSDIKAEARRLDCTHYFDPAQGDAPCPLD